MMAVPSYTAENYERLCGDLLEIDWAEKLCDLSSGLLRDIDVNALARDTAEEYLAWIKGEVVEAKGYREAQDEFFSEVFDCKEGSKVRMAELLFLARWSIESKYDEPISMPTFEREGMKTAVACIVCSYVQMFPASPEQPGV